MNDHSPRPSTLALCKATGTAPRVRTPWDESALIYNICLALQDAARRRLGPERCRIEPWCIDRRVIAALQAVLAERTCDHSMHAVAQVLAASGLEDAEVIGGLSGWDRVAYRWRNEGRSAASLSRDLQRAGLAAPDETSCARLAGWIAVPRTALGQAAALCASLLGPRLRHVSLSHNGFEPAHDALFASLVAEATPLLPVESVHQQADREPRFRPVSTELSSAQGLVAELPVDSDEGSHWVIHYRLEGRPQAFFAQCLGSRMDDKAVRQHFDALMSRRGLPQRVYRFDTETGSADWALWLVAERDRFDSLLQNLGIPAATSDRP